MVNPERHKMVYDVILDVLRSLSQNDDESAQNFENVLYVTKNITKGDIERARHEMSKLVNTINEQQF